jgi:hypothetical protein
MKPLKEDATYDDLCHVADRFIAEIVDGDLYASPRPPVRHIHAASVLAAELGTRFDWSRNGPGGWIMLNKPRCALDLGGSFSLDSAKAPSATLVRPLARSTR